MTSIRAGRLAGTPVLVLTATVIYVVLALLTRLIVNTRRPDDASYWLTHTLMPSVWWVGIVFTCIAATLGWLTLRRWPIALGLILPLPVALAIEIAKDPTSHNLFPFEILFGWGPAYLLAFVAAYAGARVRIRNMKSDGIASI